MLFFFYHRQSDLSKLKNKVKSQLITVRFLVKDTKISCFISFLENSMMSS